MLDVTFDEGTKVLTVVASGHVDHEDYVERLMPAVDDAVARVGKINLLYVMGLAFEGFETRAMWDDTRLGVQHFSDFNKVAVVTDSALMQNTIRAFGVLMPADVRAFDLGDQEVAEAWVAA
ncbi:STAS/SEC14 domain-containing protein [Rhodobacteraceae bacterium NNCM2]|nr:STAS/SEC14 domain-containing protein [Coraliihabitans acroporae]